MDIEANLKTYLERRTPSARYTSFDYCYNHFQQHSERGGLSELVVGPNMQLSCLRLGFYLARVERTFAWLDQFAGSASATTNGQTSTKRSSRSAGGTPEVYVAFDPATEVDFHSVSALPDNRVVVSIHLKTTESYRVEVVDPSGSHRRTVLISDPAVNAAQYAAQDYLVFLRFGANEGLWAVRFGDGPLDLTTRKSSIRSPAR